MGRPELTDNSASGVPAPPPEQAAAAHPMADVSTMVAQLEAQLQQSPDNAEGWRMLGWSYMHMQRPVDAAKAYAKAAALAPGNADYLSAEGEALATAAGGQVNADALKAFKAALAAAPGDPRARYYLAVAKDQSGDRKGAMEDWIALLKSAPAGAPWAAEVRGFVERTARERGEDISNRLPPAPVAAQPPGPSAADVAAASQMPQADQQAMIHGMVDKLAGELKQNPRDADGWVRLMRARMVLGETDKAAQALRDATKAFAGAPQQQAALRDQARALGVPGG
jgi:cytochrome c-type biogenesis protein CcmH